MIQCEAVQREREQGRVADDETEPRAREPRRALELEAADLARLHHLRERGSLTEAPQLDRVVFRIAVGRRLVRRIRDERQRRLARGLRGRELLLRGAQLFLDALQLLELLAASACP